MNMLNLNVSPEGKCDWVQKLCVTSCMTQCCRNMILKSVLVELKTGDCSL